MKIEGIRDIPKERQKVWEAFLNPEKLLKGIPGCIKLDSLGNDEFNAVMNVGLTPVKGLFEGKFRFSDKKPFISFYLTAEGNGRPGFVKSETLVAFSDVGMGTRVRYYSKVQVTGPMAAIGERMIDSAAKMIANQFFNRMSRLIENS